MEWTSERGRLYVFCRVTCRRRKSKWRFSLKMDLKELTLRSPEMERERERERVSSKEHEQYDSCTEFS
jgi:hypothetical protein